MKITVDKPCIQWYQLSELRLRDLTEITKLSKRNEKSS